MAGGVLAFSTKGDGSNDASRILMLLADVEHERFAFDHSAKFKSGVRLLRRLLREPPALAVMEGTGVAGGLPLIAAKWLAGVPYVVSSGDAVGPYLGLHSRVVGWLGGLYERLLCRNAAGFIGWTPYLAGRALTYGTPRVMTAANWPVFSEPENDRREVRRQLGVPEDAIVFGLVGALRWSPRRQYAYGLEMVQAIREVNRDDVVVVIAGGGEGLERLRVAAGDALGRSVFLPGPIERREVPGFLAAIDIASLPQSVDQVGAFRFTTKLSEYLRAGRPVVTGEIPLAYDLDTGWLWRLPGDAPWDPRYREALTELMQSVDPATVATKAAAVPRDLPEFDYEAQRARTGAFIRELLAARAAA
jgi:glycosyltransferase involved in cell wall biosynthesis